MEWPHTYGKHNLLFLYIALALVGYLQLSLLSTYVCELSIFFLVLKEKKLYALYDGRNILDERAENTILYVTARSGKKIIS